MTAWCPRCGRQLSNVQVQGRGSCPTHGYQWGEPYAPILVIDEEIERCRCVYPDKCFCTPEQRQPIIGLYMHKAEDGAVVYRDPSGEIRQALVDRVSVVRYGDWEGEW